MADAHAEVAALLGRTGALSPQDVDDLGVLLESHDRADLSGLPASIPGRETKARVLAWIAADTARWGTTLPVVADRIDTATDALRLLVLRGGGDAGLVRPGRMAPVARPLRRAIVGALDRLDPGRLVEDLRRHRLLWIHAAERLHPFEYARVAPRAAAAFAALRGSDLTADLRAAAQRSGLPVVDARVHYVSHAAGVELALAAGDGAAAARLLTARPGEYLRRLHHLLRTAAHGTDLDAVLGALPAMVGAVARRSCSARWALSGWLVRRSASSSPRVSTRPPTSPPMSGRR